MSLTGTVKIEGLAQIERTMLALGKPAAMRRIAKKVLLEAAEPIVATASRLAPNDPRTQGMLQISIKAIAERAKGDSQWVRIGIDSSVDPAVSVARKSGSGSYRDPGVAGNAVIQEFGTANMAANPFMRPAWEAEGPATPGRIASRLGQEVEKMAKRAGIGG